MRDREMKMAPTPTFSESRIMKKYNLTEIVDAYLLCKLTNTAIIKHPIFFNIIAGISQNV